MKSTEHTEHHVEAAGGFHKTSLDIWITHQKYPVNYSKSFKTLTSLGQMNAIFVVSLLKVTHIMLNSTYAAHKLWIFGFLLRFHSAQALPRPPPLQAWSFLHKKYLHVFQ